MSDFASLLAYGWGDRWVALFAAVAGKGTRAGRVCRHDSSALLVAVGDDQLSAPMRSDLEPVAVGDWVTVDDGAVTGVLPRLSLLRRRDAHSEREQLLAANVDLVLIVAGLDRPLRAGRLQRAVTMAWDAGAVPLVVLTKCDLSPDVEEAEGEATTANPGVDVVTVSADCDSGVDRIRDLAVGRTLVLLGESGAGKSTLVNRLAGEDVAAVGAVRRGDSKGRHTTTARQLHLLPGGGALIDTPGIRAVGLWTEAEAVAAAFDDVADLASGCRFGDCAHESEPDCAVRAAVADGSLAADRLESWATLDREARAGALRADVVARRQAERRFGRVTREAQRLKRP